MSDAAVVDKVNAYLKQSYADKGSLSVSLRIQSALRRATEDRERDSQDATQRDAEYYLHGLYATSANDFTHAVFASTAPAYNAFKWAAHQLKDAGYPSLEKWLRTNPENPLSKPGGSMWAYRGLKDGMSIDGKKEVSEKDSPPFLLKM